jgi:hypothetical protein
MSPRRLSPQNCTFRKMKLRRIYSKSQDDSAICAREGVDSALPLKVSEIFKTVLQPYHGE